MIPDFCNPNCIYLYPKERKEKHKKGGHFCSKYNKPLKHQGFHPNIVVCSDCVNKILFLDIDGVLNSTRSAVAFDGYPYKERCHEKFDKVALALIRRLCNKTDAKICLSSTWRMGYTEKTLCNLANALDLPIISKTPKFLDRISARSCRGAEIADWLQKHPEVTTYAIVDDDSDMLDEQLPFFVQTNSSEGLLYLDYLKLLKILGEIE